MLARSLCNIGLGRLLEFFKSLLDLIFDANILSSHSVDNI